MLKVPLLPLTVIVTPAKPSPGPAPVSAASPAVVVASDSDLEALWAKVLESVGRASPFARSYLLEAHPVSFAKQLFTIGFDPEFEDHIALVDNERNHALLRTKLTELGHPNTQFKFIKAEAPADRPSPPAEPPPEQPGPRKTAAPAPAPAKPDSTVPRQPASAKTSPVPFNKDDFKNDPLIQKALEIFKGQIVEVRA